MRALQHLHDFPMRAPIVIQTFYANCHAIAMHGALGFVFAQVNIAANARDCFVRHHEPEAIAVNAEAPVNQPRSFLLRSSTALQSPLRRMFKWPMRHALL